MQVCQLNDAIVKVWNNQSCSQLDLEFLVLILVSSSVVLVGFAILVVYISDVSLLRYCSVAISVSISLH